MTFSQRNQMIQDMFTEYKRNHDKFTSSKKILTNKEWDEYLNAMGDVLDKYKDTNIEQLSNRIWIALLDDTENIQKRLKDIQSLMTPVDLNSIS